MEFIAGTIDLEQSVHALDVWNYLQSMLADVEGLCGYRWPTVSVSSTSEVPSFIIIMKTKGIIICDVVDSRITQTSDDGSQWKTSAEDGWTTSRDVVLSLFENEIRNRLSKNPRLYNRRTQQLAIPVNRALIFCQNEPEDFTRVFRSDDVLAAIMYKETLNRDFEGFFRAVPQCQISDELLDLIIADLETTNSLRRSAVHGDTRSSDEVGLVSTFVRQSLTHTLKLDQTQRKISIQLPDGPQRIRGLAGTGKTVVLSLKAALAHKNYPNFKILFLFNTQSMYKQVTDWVSRYYAEEARQPINTENLHIYHAWGGRQQEGLYNRTALKYGLKPLTYRDVRNETDPLGAIYARLLEATKGRIEPQYDMVLIDEAQDFAPSIFETVFYLTKGPKRIIWAYDEFQSMKDIHMKEPEELFGLNDFGLPNVPNSSLHGTYVGGVEKDFALKNSYRNPRLNLMAAHGTALGLYRPAGIIDMIDGRASWEAIGYKILKPSTERFRAGDEVVVERPVEHSRNNLELLLRQDGQGDQQLVTTWVFDTATEENAFVVERINKLIAEDRVQPEDIFVIALDLRTSSAQLMEIRQGLDERGVKSISPGFVEEPSRFKVPGFVTLTTPFRAKGNEADFVFALNGQRVVEDMTFRARNALFVAITRSRGWTYVSGIGEAMTSLEKEIYGIKASYPQFRFIYPKEDAIARNRLILTTDDQIAEKDQEDVQRVVGDPRKRAMLIEALKSDPELRNDLKEAIQDDHRS